MISFDRIVIAYACSLFEYHFFNGSSEEVLKNLKKFQNEDGGFGHGLEPDFMLPDSSAMASTIAFQILDEIGEKNNKMAHSAIEFYETTFDQNRNGWWAVPPQVNDHPHAPWWAYDKQEKWTAIDNHWGNPSSEIIGILYEYRSQLQLLDIEHLLGYAIDHFKGLNEYGSEHEIYCYLRMFQKITGNLSKKACGTALESYKCPGLPGCRQMGYLRSKTIGFYSVKTASIIPCNRRSHG